MPRLKVIEGEGEWNESDTALMRVFLHDSLGKKAIRKLQTKLPRVTVENPANTGLLHAGYQLCLDELLKLGSEQALNHDATNPQWDHSRKE